jgi:trehalose 6-phosphate synthase/phosphatase
LAIGDDWTDEYLYRELPKSAVTINVGMENTTAVYKIESVQSVRQLLKSMAE